MHIYYEAHGEGVPVLFYPGFDCTVVGRTSLKDTSGST